MCGHKEKKSQSRDTQSQGYILIAIPLPVQVYIKCVRYTGVYVYVFYPGPNLNEIGCVFFFNLFLSFSFLLFSNPFFSFR